MSGTHRIVVETGQALPELDWPGELADLTDAWPYLGPTWLAANERAMPEAKPWHTVAKRGHGELALLPGFVLTAPPAVDHDPRTYLGWQPPSGDSVCCGVDVAGAQSAAVDAMGEQAFLPTLLLGSPLGYRTEVAYNFWSPGLFAAMVERLVPAAFDAGIRSVVAPWIPDRAGNDALVAALREAGGHATFWGYEDYVTLSADSWDAHVAGLPTKKRQRVNADERRAAASGVEITRVDGADIRPHVSRIAELTCLNREKNGAGEQPEHIETILTGLLDARVDVRAYFGRLDGEIVASCVTLRKGDRLTPKWAGFDYARLGEHSGIYFAMVLNAPVRDAYAEGLHTVEFGAGAHEAKTLRGCQSRAVTTALVLADPALRPAAAELLDGFGAARRVAFGDAPPASQPRALTLLSNGGGACCGNG
ncbi:GNAT family N-acetyltransferase [Dactylosporangium sp. CA-092794]|uniref:GNAT family N-acetyltransferase n=1 Tax=Dactylosporangium sp. CA-092794 TaxID=3239929 RepID=UPI003D8DF762